MWHHYKCSRLLWQINRWKLTGMLSGVSRTIELSVPGIINDTPLKIVETSVMMTISSLVSWRNWWKSCVTSRAISAHASVNLASTTTTTPVASSAAAVCDARRPAGASSTECPSPDGEPCPVMLTRYHVSRPRPTPRLRHQLSGPRYRTTNIRATFLRVACKKSLWQFMSRWHNIPIQVSNFKKKSSTRSTVTSWKLCQ